MTEFNEQSSLYDKVLGSLAGSALGDAIGGATEMMSYQKIEEIYGWVDQPLPSGETLETARFDPGRPAGVITDDTQLKHLLCEAIIRKGGRIIADDWAEIWLEQMEGWFYTPVVNAFHKLFHGTVRPRDAGRGCMGSNSSAMSISPVGIINACNPAQAAQDAYDVAGLIHEGYPRDGACAVAAAVAEAFAPQATVESVLQASTTYLYPKGQMKPLIEQALELARQTGEYKTFRKAFYEQMLIPYPQNAMVAPNPPPEGFYDTAEPRETVPTAMALILLADGQWRVAVEYAANFGRDADTIGAIVGAIAGAFEGTKAIPEAWITLLNDRNPFNQQALATRMTQAVLQNMASIQAHLAMLETLATD